MGRGLKLIGFPNVSAFKDQHGKTRYRYRRTDRRPSISTACRARHSSLRSMRRRATGSRRRLFLGRAGRFLGHSTLLP